MKRAVVAGLAVLLIAGPAFAKSGSGSSSGHSGHAASSSHNSGHTAHIVTSDNRPSSTSSSGGSGGRSNSSSMHNDSHYRNRSPSEPTRRVSEQDCTKSITLDGGNLKCK